jgi:hypothetical protein
MQVKELKHGDIFTINCEGNRTVYEFQKLECDENGKVSHALIKVIAGWWPEGGRGKHEPEQWTASAPQINNCNPYAGQDDVRSYLTRKVSRRASFLALSNSEECHVHCEDRVVQRQDDRGRVFHTERDHCPDQPLWGHQNVVHFEIIVGHLDGTTTIQKVDTIEECLEVVKNALLNKDVVFVEIEPWKS